MKEEMKAIERAMASISVPHDKLDAMIEETVSVQSQNAPVRKKRKKGMAIAAAACLAAGISGLSTAVYTPAIANTISDLPVIGSVFDMIASTVNDKYTAYSSLAEAVGQTSESKGIAMTVEQGIFDGTTITLSVRIATEKDFGSSLYIGEFPEVKGTEPQNSGYSLEKVDGFGYAGVLTINPRFLKTTDTASLTWEPEMLYGDGDLTVDGDWKFNLTLPVIEEDVRLFAQQVENEGVTIRFTEIRKTDLTVNLFYQQLIDPAVLDEWTAVEAELLATDDLGNEYAVPYNGGYTDGDAQTAEDLKWNATIHGLDPQATKLYIHPMATLSTLNHSKIVTFDMVEFDLQETDKR